MLLLLFPAVAVAAALVDDVTDDTTSGVLSLMDARFIVRFFSSVFVFVFRREKAQTSFIPPPGKTMDQDKTAAGGICCSVTVQLDYYGVADHRIGRDPSMRRDRNSCGGVK